MCVKYYGNLLTTFQFQRTVLGVQRKSAKIHEAHCRYSYPVTVERTALLHNTMYTDVGLIII